MSAFRMLIDSYKKEHKSCTAHIPRANILNWKEIVEQNIFVHYRKNYDVYSRKDQMMPKITINNGTLYSDVFKCKDMLR